MLHAPAGIELGNSPTQVCHIAFRVERIQVRREFKWDFAISCDALRKNQKCGGNRQPDLVTNFMQTHRQIIIHTHHNILRHLYHFLSYIRQMLHSLYHKNSPPHKKTQPRAELRFFRLYASIAAYRSPHSTCSIYSYGVMRPSTTMEKMLGLQPETSMTPCSFIVTGC